jgi:O-antigen/teichoic acid export membrane protein
MSNTPDGGGPGEGNARWHFFRQSAWMMFAAVANGVLMFAVHPLSKIIPEVEYGVLGVYLQLINWLTIPAVGLRMVFAHQTSAALTEPAQRELSGTVHAIFKGTFYLWLIMAVGIAWGQGHLTRVLQLTNPAGLWVTLLLALTMLWLPIMQGVMQGQQNFLWLGTSDFMNGLGRFSIALIAVMMLGWYAAGIMMGALMGMVFALAVGLWQSRSVWRAKGSRFAWRPWLAHVAPLTLGFGTAQYMLSADMIFVGSHFPGEQTPPYVAAGTLGRALVAFTGPLAAVMFPKLVRSHKKAEPTDVLWLTLLSTGVLGGLGATMLTILAPLVIQLGFRSDFVSIAPLVPWFGWCMLPLAMANVLINNLMAKSRFAAVPWMVGVAVAYTVVLQSFGLKSFLSVVQTLGLFNLLLLGISAWFSWKAPPKRPMPSTP